MARQLPLNAFALTFLISGAPGTGQLVTQGGGALLTQGGGALLIQAPAPAAPPMAAATGFNGQAGIGPTAQGEVWQAGYVVSVHCSTNVREATCKVYAGAGVSPAYFIGATTWGSTGDSSSNTPQLQVGQQVYAVWTGGDPGAEAYLTITGTRTV